MPKWFALRSSTGLTATLSCGIKSQSLNFGLLVYVVPVEFVKEDNDIASLN